MMEEKLNAKAMENIKKSLDDIKNGRTYSMDEVKKRLGIK